MKIVPLRQGIIVVQIQYEIWLFSILETDNNKVAQNADDLSELRAEPSPHWIMGNKLM